MNTKKLFTIPDTVDPSNLEEVMQQAIALELATIPTYLSTYYSIIRAQDQDKLYSKLQSQLTASFGKTEIDINALAQELKVDILVYANQAAALIMSVVIEEMLHLALASNVKQALFSAPDLLSISKSLVFPTQLDGHEPEFPINAAKLSLDQLSTFLQIESPDPFVDPADSPETDQHVEKYKTIGLLYDKIIACIEANFPGPYPVKPQLLPPQPAAPPRPYYSQNSINTVYYDRNHNPVFGNADDSGSLIGVADAASAVAALNEIKHQGEGSTSVDHDKLTFDQNNMPVPLPVVNGKVQFKQGDFDDPSQQELSHFDKFLEVYSLGGYYQQKFANLPGLDDFFSYFVYNQPSNPKQADYDQSDNAALSLCSQLGNAIFTYILLMIETCYYKDEATQFDVFMYGIHKSMIWLLSGVGNSINAYTYTKEGQTYTAALTFEYFPFENTPGQSPKAQILSLVDQLAVADPGNWGWLTDPKYAGYWPSLPDVGLDHSVAPNIPAIPA
jgi:hypothetical protein